MGTYYLDTQVSSFIHIAEIAWFVVKDFKGFQQLVSFATALDRCLHEKCLSFRKILVRNIQAIERTKREDDFRTGGCVSKLFF